MLYKRRVFLTLLFVLVTVVGGSRSGVRKSKRNWLAVERFSVHRGRCALKNKNPLAGERSASTFISRAPPCSESRSFDWIEEIPKQVRDDNVVTANMSHHELVSASRRAF
jgi:hypothetical protein